MIEALKDAGGKPKYTSIPASATTAGTRPMAPPELYDWLLKQQLK